MFLRKVFSQYFIAKCFKKSLLFKVFLDMIPRSPMVTRGKREQHEQRSRKDKRVTMAKNN